jgi:hypothetical protein
MVKIKHIKSFVLCVMILFGSSLPASTGVVWARTSLVSLPLRQTVDLRLGSNGKTLVQEKRVLLIKKGINKIDFSWQNVMIDPSSITIESLSNKEKFNILSVSYPPNESALVWDISSDTDLESEVMISYLLANIDKIVTYKAITGIKEKAIDLKSFLVLRNFSGENFDTVTAHQNFGKSFVTGIRNLETKRILFDEKKDIPIKKRYTWDSSKMPHEPEKTDNAGIPTSYEFKSALFQGKARIYQNDTQGSTIFLGEDTTKFTQEGKTSLIIGESRDIVVTQLRIDTKRTNIKRNTKGNIQVYDEIIKDKITIENLKDTPATLSLIETIQGHWEPLDISMEYQREDHKTLIFDIPLLPKEKKTLNMNYQVLNIFAKKFAQYNRMIE